jgi:hypothetical protein
MYLLKIRLSCQPESFLEFGLHARCIQVVHSLDVRTKAQLHERLIHHSGLMNFQNKLLNAPPLGWFGAGRWPFFQSELANQKSKIFQGVGQPMSHPLDYVDCTMNEKSLNVMLLSRSKDGLIQPVRLASSIKILMDSKLAESHYLTAIGAKRKSSWVFRPTAVHASFCALWVLCR